MADVDTSGDATIVGTAVAIGLAILGTYLAQQELKKQREQQPTPPQQSQPAPEQPKKMYHIPAAKAEAVVS